MTDPTITTVTELPPAGTRADHEHHMTLWEHSGGCEHRWCLDCSALDIHPNHGATEGGWL